jgi:hypothetical protein
MRDDITEDRSRFSATLVGSKIGSEDLVKVLSHLKITITSNGEVAESAFSERTTKDNIFWYVICN